MTRKHKSRYSALEVGFGKENIPIEEQTSLPSDFSQAIVIEKVLACNNKIALSHLKGHPYIFISRFL